MESIDIEEMDCDTCLKMQEILREEIDDPEFLEFAIENLSELLSYIATGRTNIRIHMELEGLPDEQFGGQDVVWGGVDIHNVRKDSSYCNRTIFTLTHQITLSSQ